MLGRAREASFQLVGSIIQLQLFFDDEYAAAVAFEEAKTTFSQGNPLMFGAGGIKSGG